MARCFSCHADSCNRRKNCSCPCHNEERLQSELKDKVLAEKLAALLQCPKCNHLMTDHNDNDGHFRYQCYERLSNENNDFCGCVHGKPAQEPILLYAIRNQQGQWFKPYTKGSSASWQDDLGFAKIYANESTAAGNITRLVNEAERNRRGGGPIPAPELVEFIVTETRVIDQKERLAKAKKKKLEDDARQEAYLKEVELMNAQEEFDKAQVKLFKLRGKTK